MSLCNLIGVAAKYLVTTLDGYICYPLTGKYALTISQRAYDQELIDKLNGIIYTKMRDVPAVLERAFPGAQPPNAVEREAIHSYVIRAFIHASQIPAEAERFFRGLNHDQQMVCLAYLSAIDQGGEASKGRYGKYYARIDTFSDKFLADAERDERDYYESQGLPVPKSGNRLRPLNAHDRINLGPKFRRHPVTALMLGECRRILFPKTQQQIDGNFHRLNTHSRSELIEKMKGGPKQVAEGPVATVTTYETPVQVEFFPDRKSTDKPSYLNDIQGAGALTTEGIVTEYTFKEGKQLYLVKYKNYKAHPVSEKYLVSNGVPVGREGEVYEAELDLATAQQMVLEQGQR